MAEFTIITPVLNGAAYIERCIQSVAEQDMAVQHIIMDGGSTDGTQDILAQNAHLLASWESTSDSGQSYAINKGLKLAEGRICNWLNADDVLCNGALQEVSGLMTDDVNVVFGRCAHVNTEGETVVVGGTMLYPTVEQTLGRYSMGQPSHFYRTETWKQLGPLRESLHYAMDMELWFRYLLQFGQHKIASTEKVLSHFLLRGDAKSQRMKTQMEQEKYGVFRALFSQDVLSMDIDRFLSGFQIPADFVFEVRQQIDRSLLLAHVCYPLLPKLYLERDMDTLKAALDVVSAKGLLSTKEQAMWQLRLLKLRTTA